MHPHLRPSLLLPLCALLWSACIFTEAEVSSRAPSDAPDLQTADMRSDLPIDAPDLPEDQASDQSAPPDMACEPIEDAAVCAAAGVQCGALRALDNCDAERLIDCGGCPQGACAENGTCQCIPETDEAFCERKDRQCGPAGGSDSCGQDRLVLSCGTCSGAGERCTASGKCECMPRTNAQLCGQAGRQCGMHTIVDNCGDERRILCGMCQAGVCNQDGTCSVCQPETDEGFCARLGATCGDLVGTDNCGATRRASCGDCGQDEQCSANACACIPPTCDAGVECGVATNQCGATPCGPRGGACEAGQTCNKQGRCECAPESDAAFCARLGAQCGIKSGVDSCGVMRQGVNCGGCASGSSCDAMNQCACAPESDAAFCARLGAQCGPKQGVDNCGVTRTAQCGTCADGGGCDASTNQCGSCASESDAAFCARAPAAECGPKLGVDSCGKPRCVANCGTCSTAKGCCRGVCSVAGMICTSPPIACD